MKTGRELFFVMIHDWISSAWESVTSFPNSCLLSFLIQLPVLLSFFSLFFSISFPFLSFLLLFPYITLCIYMSLLIYLSLNLSLYDPLLLFGVFFSVSIFIFCLFLSLSPSLSAPVFLCLCCCVCLSLPLSRYLSDSICLYSVCLNPPLPLLRLKRGGGRG